MELGGLEHKMSTAESLIGLGSTCGLENSDRLPSDNITPQETTEEESGMVGADGPGLPCPGSSVVADRDGESGWFISSADSETTSFDRSTLFHSHSLAEEAVDEPIDIDWTQ